MCAGRLVRAICSETIRRRVAPDNFVYTETMLWRSQRSRPLAPRAPVGFIETCQPTLARSAPSGSGWIHEVKHDGYRIIARKRGGRVRLWSRHMTDFSDRFTGIVAAMRKLPTDVVLDGEAVVLRPDGHSDFLALNGKEGGAQAVLIAFDVLEVEGLDLRKEPIERRRAMLHELLAAAPDGITINQAIDGDGDVIFRHACAMGLEGIVSKRLGSSYRSGRCAHWLKIKNPAFERC
jgi:bifunctional non-homologous end joining protein LigD